MANNFTYALSWSRLSDFLQCPLKFKYKYIDKLSNFTVMDDSPHLVRGTNVHKALENYINKRIEKVENIPPSSLPEVESTKPLINSFIDNFQTVTAEQQISVRQDWTQTEWFSKDSYYRAIYDFVAISSNEIVIVDFKTGKYKDYSESGYGQLELSATIGLNMFPQIPVLHTLYAYVDHKKTIKRSFTQAEDKERLTMHFTKMHEIVNSEKDWDPTKNEFCNFCSATKLQCKFSRKL